MPGYLISLNDISALEKCIKTGIYSTRIKALSANIWRTAHEGTYADFCSMKKGDNIYFFHKRKIYGVGVLTNINKQCTFLNYPKSNQPKNHLFEDIQKNILVDNGEEGETYRFICTFIPSPLFFKNGIDMDEVLASAPTNFRSIRVFWGLSFIKFTEEENLALKSIIIRKNSKTLLNNDRKSVFEFDRTIAHDKIEKLTNTNNNYTLTIQPFLDYIQNKDGSLKHEMAIEAAIMYQITQCMPSTSQIFGNWDYISHQVAASPFKPIDYMDKMDVFGYKYLDDQTTVIIKYLIIEIKRDNVIKDDILQLMKYVDWVKSELTGGDYSMIEAFIVGHKFNDELKSNYKQICQRNYISGFRPTTPEVWNNVKLVKYNYSGSTEVNFSLVK